MDVKDHLKGIPLEIGFVLDAPPYGLWMVGVVHGQRRVVSFLLVVLHQTDGHVLGVLHQSCWRRWWTVVLQVLRRVVLRLLVVLLLTDDLLDLFAGLLPLVDLLQQDVAHEVHPIEVLPRGSEALVGVLGVALLLQFIHIALLDDRPSRLHKSCR